MCAPISEKTIERNDASVAVCALARTVRGLRRTTARRNGSTGGIPLARL